MRHFLAIDDGPFPRTVIVPDQHAAGRLIRLTVCFDSFVRCLLWFVWSVTDYLTDLLNHSLLLSTKPLSLYLSYHPRYWLVLSCAAWRRFQLIDLRQVTTRLLDTTQQSHLTKISPKNCRRLICHSVSSNTPIDSESCLPWKRLSIHLEPGNAELSLRVTPFINIR